MPILLNTGSFVRKLLFCMLAFTAPVHAVSFDCGKANTALDKATCSDSHLSALDDQMNHAYRDALEKAGEGDVVVRHDQRVWLSEMQGQCTTREIRTCIEQQQTSRINELRATIPFKPANITEYKISDASHYFDFILRIFAKAPETGDDSREGPGRLLVYS